MIDDNIIQAVWDKGYVVDGYPSTVIRKDSCGAWIVRTLYGVENNVFGWNIDHVYPKSKLLEMNVSEDRIDDILNLRPMNCANNLSKSDSYPFYHSRYVSDGEINIENDKIFEINKELQNKLSELYNDKSV